MTIRLALILVCSSRRATRQRGGALVHPRGFTLAEMCLSLSILAMISAACASVLVVTVRAIESGAKGPGAMTAAARAATDWITDDMKLAVAFSEQTATAVTMTVPDRTNDGTVETIRYAWSGAAGSTIKGFTIPAYTVTRELNGGNPITLASDVRTFALSYETRDVGPQPAKEGAEEVLAWHEGADGPGIQEAALGSANWVAQHGTITLLHNAVSWKLTKVRLKLRRNGSPSNTLTVQVRPVDATGKPNGASVGGGSVNASTLSGTAPEWVTIPFSPTIALDKTKQYAIVLTISSSGSSGTVAYAAQDGSNGDATQKYSTTTNSGTNWSSAVTSPALQYYLYGTQTTQDPS